MSNPADSLPPPIPPIRRLDTLQGPTLRAVLIGLIWVLLWIPLGMLDGLRAERHEHAEAAARTIAEGWGGPQRLSGVHLRRQTPIGPFTLLPEVQRASVRLRSESRQIGIHQLPVYLADIRLEGHFRATDLALLLDLGNDDNDVNAAAAADSGRGAVVVQLGLLDPVGLRSLGELRLGEQILTLLPATQRLQLTTLSAPIELTAAADLPFTLELTLAGAQALDLLPFGRDFQLSVQGDWPHPGFGGRLLPVERKVGEAGFTARWQVSELNRAYPQLFDDQSGSIEQLVQQSAVGVSLKQMAGAYQQHERALKYAAMFIALALCGFWLVELWLGLPLHPLHYGLAGLTQVMFYLLLLALAEHLGFGLAWLLAAAAVVLLTGSWCIAILKARRRGVLAGALLAAIYVLLYGLVVAEEHSLLMGSLLLFAMLALLMWLTRQLGGGSTPIPEMRA